MTLLSKWNQRNGAVQLIVVKPKLGYDYTMRFIGYGSIQTYSFVSKGFQSRQEREKTKFTPVGEGGSGC